MTRLALVGLAAAALLLLPATAQSHSGVRIRGIVALKDEANHLVSVRAARQAVSLRVPGSLALIRVGQRVELRGSNLRQHGNGSRLLARNVTIASSGPLATPAPPPNRDDDEDDDEVEITGKLTSLAPVVVQSTTRTVTCVVPPGTSLAGFAIGDVVEVTCDLKAGVFVLRALEHEDEDEDDQDEADDDGHRGPGGGGGGDHSGRGHGGGGDD